MLRLSAALACLVAASSLLLAAADDVDLTDADFQSTLDAEDVALVMFYAPWCGHCKKLKPEFTKAAGILKANDPAVMLAKVDCTEAGKETCGKFSVSGYPTIKIFRNGEMASDYNGPRDFSGIVKYMKGQAGSASKELKSAEDLAAFLVKPEVVVVSYEADPAIFLKAADKLRETVTFGHVTGDLAVGGIKLHRPKHLRQPKFEPDALDFDGKMDARAIESWVTKSYHGIVGHRTVDNAKEFETPLFVALYNVDYMKDVKGTNFWRNRIMKVAVNHPDLNFAISNKDDFQQEASEFGVDVYALDKQPAVVARNAANGKFVMKAGAKDAKEFVDNLEAFIAGFEAGNLEQYLKSEPVPEQTGPVKVAVAKNFGELVTDSPNDVLVEFYAPWCGHCKKLTPIYDELAEKMSAETVDIVKMDATANDVPSGYDVKGFPTLFWLPKKSKKAVSYNGGRELDDFVQYIAENAGDELAGWDRKGKEKKTEL
jgi:protein disulfide isomerase family A protein 3